MKAADPRIPRGSSRIEPLRLAVILSVISIILSGLVGLTAVVYGLTSGGLSLLGFGFDAAVDAAASVVLVWRFMIEAREPDRAMRVERVAETVVGVVLIVLACDLVFSAMNALATGGRPQVSDVGRALLALSLLLLPALALAKYRVARRIGSRALRADSLLTAIAAILAAISLTSIGLSEVLGLWWADAAGALLVSFVLLREGWLSVRAARRGVEFGD